MKSEIAVVSPNPTKPLDPPLLRISTAVHVQAETDAGQYYPDGFSNAKWRIQAMSGNAASGSLRKVRRKKKHLQYTKATSSGLQIRVNWGIWIFKKVAAVSL